jgi:hypothetical protein
MVLPTLLVVFGAVAFVLFRWFRNRPSTASTWRGVMLLGLAIGLTRATLASFGWYVVEHTGGPAQVPAFLLVMLAWPEAVFLPRVPPSGTPVSAYMSLFVLLVVGSFILVTAIAAVARMVRPPG